MLLSYRTWNEEDGEGLGLHPTRALGSKMTQ